MKRILAVILLIATLFILPIQAHEKEHNNILSIAQTIFYQNESHSLSFYYTVCTCDMQGANKIAEVGIIIDTILIKDRKWRQGFNSKIVYKYYIAVNIFHAQDGMIVYISENGKYKWFKEFYIEDDSRAIALNIIEKVLSKKI